jgi:hypothetical protein
MILNGTINYLQLREHKKFQKMVNVPPPSALDDNNSDSAKTAAPEVAAPLSSNVVPGIMNQK